MRCISRWLWVDCFFGRKKHKHTFIRPLPRRPPLKQISHAVDCFIGGLSLSPDLALIYIQKKQLCLRKTNENQLVYKLYDLTPKRLKLSRSSMRGNEIVCQKWIIGIDENSNHLFGRDEQDLQDATQHRNPVHPVKNLAEWTETLKTN